MTFSRSQRLYAMGVLLAAGAGVVISLFLPWLHDVAPPGSGSVLDQHTYTPMAQGDTFAHFLRLYSLVAAVIFLLGAAGQYFERSSALRVLLVVAVGVAIVQDFALLLLAWIVLSLLNDTAVDSYLDVGFYLCFVSLVLACVGCLLTAIGKRRAKQ